jgi:hydrogenase 3 maturation protease
MDSLSNLFPGLPGEKIMILGVGNTLRGDDGVGPTLIRDLRGKVGCGLLDCGEVPENHLQKIIDFGPDTIVIVDAADWGGNPGEMREISPEEIANPGFSSHNSSLGLVLAYLRAHLRAKIIIIGVQSRTREFLDPMSPEAKRALKALEDLLVRLLSPSRYEDSSS